MEKNKGAKGIGCYQGLKSLFGERIVFLSENFSMPLSINRDHCQ